ncbi:MAG: hypothetical protein HY332_00755 [Chloroflexi bacterium]|nr:hypothetical protein [Chloroflexota bacterium]
MVAFLVRRLAFVLFTLWLVSVATFGVTQLLPGDVASAILGQNATPEDLARLRGALGLDRPVWVRYKVQGSLHDATCVGFWTFDFGLALERA